MQGAGARLSGLCRLGLRARNQHHQIGSPRAWSPERNVVGAFVRSQGVLPGGGGSGCRVSTAQSLDGGHQSRDDLGRAHLQGRNRAGRRMQGAGRLPPGHRRMFRTWAGQGTSLQTGSGRRTVRGTECPSQEGRHGPQARGTQGGFRVQTTPAPVG